MLRVRVIPTLLWKQFGLVKGIGFDSWRRVGPVRPAIRVYNTRDVDELLLVDIAATPANQPPDFESISDFAEDCFVPFTVGGGVRDVVQIQKLLRAGADKICVNSAAYLDRAFLADAAKRFGTQCIVASIDVRRHDTGSYECFSHCGMQPTGLDPVSWARQVESEGGGEILLTSVERDGTMEGYDIALIEKVASAVKIPVIASGGAGNYEHMRQAIQEGGASAVAAASMFHYTEQTPAEAKKALQKAGIAVRDNFVSEGRPG